MVEAIQYTHMPLYSEKLHVINTAMIEITETISRQDEKLDILEQYIAHYLPSIQDYQAGTIDFTTLLQQLQPLQLIPNPENNKNIDAFNIAATIINSLHYTPHHEPILQQQCLRIQKLLHPEQMPLIVDTLQCWST
jgi:hypothetical protein